LLDSTLENCREVMIDADSTAILSQYLGLLKNEFELLGEREEIAPFENINSLNPDDFNDEVYQNAFGYLTYLKFQNENSREEVISENEDIIRSITDSLKNHNLEDFALENHNKGIETLVKGRSPEGFARIEKERILKFGSSIYMLPESKIGRAGFFSAYRRFNNQYFETFSYNLSAIWMLNLVLYVFLIGDFTRMIFNVFRKNKLEKY